MQIKAFTLDSFASTPGGGNPAGVVLDFENLLTPDEMQLIAEKIGFSETAFIKKSLVADFNVRFFTPTEEVDLCGHATIGAFSLLEHLGMISVGTYTQETKAGLLDVEITSDKKVFMDQSLPEFFEKLEVDEISNSLGLDPSAIDEKLPIQIVSTGLKDIIIPLKSIKNLDEISPDFEKITSISKKYDVVGYHVFALSSETNELAVCRNFAPLYGIPEESATGTSNGALVSYLFEHNKLSTTENLSISQGISMNKPSTINVSLKIEDKKIKRVLVGGLALNFKEINIQI